MNIALKPNSVTVRRASATAAPTSCGGSMPAPSRRPGSSAQNCASQSLYARAIAAASSGSIPSTARAKSPAPRKEHRDVDSFPIHRLELGDGVVAAALGVGVPVGLAGLDRLEHLARDRRVVRDALAFPLD